MAKKGANQESKKTQQKRKEQVIEDRTFGLKNKNKSKKVQMQIKSIEKNVMNSGDPKMRKLEEQRRQAKAEAKARKKAMEDERNALFGEALLAVQKKNVDHKFGKVEAKGRDANDDNAKKQTSRAMKMMFQMDAQEMSEKLREDPNYVATIEDEIEAARQKKVDELKKAGKGTPVTPESFAAWQERKRQKRADQLKKTVEAEFRKKKGKGLSVLSGRELYEYKRDVFKDMDEDAEDGVSLDGNQETNESRHSNPLSARSSSRLSESDDKPNGHTKGVELVAANVQSSLFLDDDVDLDDLEDD